MGLRGRWLLPVLPLVVAGCGGGTPTAQVAAAPRSLCTTRNGGAEIQIQVVDQTYRFWSTKAAFIDKAKDLKASGKTHVAMLSRLADGKDCDAQWTFHSDPADMSWPDLAVEVCDGKPSDVEGNKSYWINTVKQWCPWTAKVLSVEDRR